MADRRGLHKGEVNVSKETVKAIAAREKEAAANRKELNTKIEKAADKANAAEKKRA